MKQPSKLKTVPASSSLPTRRLFEEQMAHAVVPSAFVHSQFLTSRFRACPDPVLAELGGNRVEVAIGLDRTMYQLEVHVPKDTEQGLTARWIKAETTRRRPNPGVAVPLQLNRIPVTLDAAVTSLCETFGLCREKVLRAGVDLLAFWEGTNALDRLELPMSGDSARYSLARFASN